MVLSNNLKKSDILTNCKAKDRWDLIDTMLDQAVKNKYVSPDDRETIRKSLFDREKSMSTGIGKGVAIPHCTNAKVDDVIIIMAICNKGINFDAIDNLPVQVAILLIVPKNKLTQHIKTLANIAKIMNDNNLREEIINAKTADSILKIITQYENPQKK
ncbi:MAG: PTS sugar transporter subunit IIA [Spirochaetota bacterium]